MLGFIGAVALGLAALADEKIWRHANNYDLRDAIKKLVGVGFPVTYQKMMTKGKRVKGVLLYEVVVGDKSIRFTRNAKAGEVRSLLKKLGINISLPERGSTVAPTVPGERRAPAHQPLRYDDEWTEGEG